MKKNRWKSFDLLWFMANQGVLLFLLNAPALKYWFRWVLRIHRDLAWREKVWQIQPDHYKVLVGIVGKRSYFRGDFRAHWKFSKRIYHAFKYVWWGVHTWDSILALVDQLVPRLQWSPRYGFGYDTLTAYPDPDPETNTVDGEVLAYVESPYATWAELVAHAGVDASDSMWAINAIYIQSSFTTDKWYQLTRSIYLFKTDSIGSDKTISDATLSLYGLGNSDSLGAAPNINIYSSNPASSTGLAGGDFDSLGSTPFSTAIAYASFSDAGYNDFALNDDGKGAINKAGVSKFGARNANYDVSGSAPTWASNKTSSIGVYGADETGTTKDPKLVVNYSETVDENLSVTGSGVVSETEKQDYVESIGADAQGVVELADTVDFEYPEVTAVGSTQMSDAQAYVDDVDEVVAAGVVAAIDAQQYFDYPVVPCRAPVKIRIVAACAPVVKGKGPASGETAVSINRSVSFYLLPELSGEDGVDLSTVRVRINSVEYKDGDPEFSHSGDPNGYFISVSHPDWANSQSVSVEVDAASLSGVAMVTAAYAFTTEWESASTRSGRARVELYQKADYAFDVLTIEEDWVRQGVERYTPELEVWWGRYQKLSYIENLEMRVEAGDINGLGKEILDNGYFSVKVDAGSFVPMLPETVINLGPMFTHTKKSLFFKLMVPVGAATTKYFLLDLVFEPQMFFPYGRLRYGRGVFAQAGNMIDLAPARHVYRAYVFDTAMWNELTSAGIVASPVWRGDDHQW